MREMKEPNHGPAFRLGTGSTAVFSQVAFSSMQLTSNVAPDVYTGGILTKEGQYGPLGKLADSAAANFIDCTFTDITVQVRSTQVANLIRSW